VSDGPTLPPPPDGMPVHIDHDGVDWEDRYGTTVRRVLFGSVSLIALAGAGAMATVGLLLPSLGVVVAGLVPLVLATRRGGQSVVLRPDRLWIGEPPDRVEILLDDLTEVRVSTPDSRQASLVVASREGRFPLGLGAPVEHLEWFAAAIARARHHGRRTEQADGHELFFHRQTPEAFEKGPSDGAARREGARLSERRRKE